jgi:hypothetical protein
MSDEIIKCLKCGHILISGSGMLCIFGPGTSIECMKCGNKHVFGNEKKQKILNERPAETLNLP